MNYTKSILLTALSAIFLVSCDDEIGVTTPSSLGDYDNGIVILNQGNFGQDNANVSYISNNFEKFENNFFNTINPTVTLGNTAQDIGFYNNLAFIVINGSNKIQVVNRYSFKHIQTISGFNNPRYITFSNGKGFVTNWGIGSNTADDYVAVLNLSTFVITASIPVAEGPERIVANNNSLYVAHIGGYGYGKTISVINAATNTLTTSITVGDVPNALKIQGNSLFVICGGNPSYVSPPAVETSGKLVKIDFSNNSIASTISFAGIKHPSNIDIVGNDLYYTVDAGIFKTSLNATTLPTTPVFSTTAQGIYGIYSFEIENNSVFVGDAGDYNSNGKVYIYSTEGVLKKTFTVGVIPAGFYFN